MQHGILTESGTEKEQQVKTKEISLKYELQLIIMYQYWFVNCGIVYPINVRC